MSRIGVFGGTFNPPHLGHLRLAQAAKAQCALDTVLIMPANIPPHKQAHDLVAGDDRLALCRLTFADEGFVVSDLELRRTGKSISPETLRMYANETLGLTEGEGYHVLLLEPMELSSTMIRETIRQGGDASGYLTAPANAYLKEKGLYR